MVRMMAPLFDASEQMSAQSNMRALNYHLMGGNEVGVTSASPMWRKLRAARTERCSHHLRVPNTVAAPSPGPAHAAGHIRVSGVLSLPATVARAVSGIRVSAAADKGHDRHLPRPA